MFQLWDGDEGLVSRAFVLPEYDNVYFGHKHGPLKLARRRLIPNPATLMHGSLVCDGEVVASWRWRNGDVELDVWTSLPAAASEEFERFVDWYRRTDEFPDPR